jgi:hypothetical protein
MVKILGRGVLSCSDINMFVMLLTDDVVPSIEQKPAQRRVVAGWISSTSTQSVGYLPV